MEGRRRNQVKIELRHGKDVRDNDKEVKHNGVGVKERSETGIALAMAFILIIITILHYLHKPSLA